VIHLIKQALKRIYLWGKSALGCCSLIISARFISRNKKISLIMNYHRIGDVDPDNPFARLHTVSFDLFCWQIRMLKKLGTFASLEAISKNDFSGQIGIGITFDDVSSSIISAIEYLENEEIPFTLCPCAMITENGYGERDKVYWLINKLSPDYLYQYVLENALEGVPDKSKFSFYGYTKKQDLSPEWVKDRIVEPLMQNAPGFNAAVKEKKPYLTWEELSKISKEFSMVSFANHGMRHNFYSDFSESDILDDLRESLRMMHQKTGIETKIFAVPFGDINSVSNHLLSALNAECYNCVLWVDLSYSNKLEVVDNSSVTHLIRIHTSGDKFEFTKNIKVALSHRVNLNKKLSCLNTVDT
jgi:hypothetical protein